MKSILIISFFISNFLFCEPAAVTYSLKSLDNLWRSFKKNHSRSYHNTSHEEQRKGLFNNALNQINTHNKRFNSGQETYTIGITKFSDWTLDEFTSFIKKGGIHPDSVPLPVKNSTIVSVKSLPTSIDWRTKNVIQSIKDQGLCGSCWAFASVSALESYVSLATGQLLNLSEQNLVDCTYSRDGCLGGLDPNAFNYVLSNNGIATQTNYPYVSGITGQWNGKCNYVSSMNSGVKVTGYTQVTGSDIGLTQALATIGPITAYFYAGSSKFQLYTSGVYSDPACLGTQINHAIMLVGYGADANNNPYYILRNSWGAGWGMNGYMYIARGNNMCSIASYNYYPSVTYTTTTKAPLTTSSNNNRVIACEGQSLTLQCPVGQNLNIIKVNYGRTDSSTCGSWSNTNCLLDQTNYFITQCNNKNQCTVVATNSVFGDPCRNTGKYLDAQYTCK